MFICNTFAGRRRTWRDTSPSTRAFRAATSSTRSGDISEKEKRDYVYCLQKALQYRTNHVIMIEDDAVPCRDMLDVLKHVVDTRVEERYKSGDLVVRHWAYVKLFHPTAGLGTRATSCRRSCCSEVTICGGCGGSTIRSCAVLCIAFSSPSPSTDRTCTPCSGCRPTSTACPRRVIAARRSFTLTPRRPSRSAATWRRRRATADSLDVAVRARAGLHHAAGAAERRQTYWAYFDAERHL